MPQVVVAETRLQGQLGRVLDEVRRDRAPHPQRQAPFVAHALEDPWRAEPAVLVVDRADAARGREPEAEPRRLDPLLDRREDVAVAELPGRLLAEDPGRPPLGVPLDDAAVDLEVAVRRGERRRVQPDRVVVLRDQDGRRPTRRLVQGLLRRLDARCPVA